MSVLRFPQRVQTSAAPAVPSQPVRAANGDVFAPSSFGMQGTTFGTDFDPESFANSPRVAELQFREAFYRCTHHDGKRFDFSGRIVPPSGMGAGTQPFIGGSLPTFYVPLDQRRPDDPYRLAKLIVDSFTALIFGADLWPSIEVAGDDNTKDFAEALVDEAGLRTTMTLARTVGGACGSVGLSWAFVDGKPEIEIHLPYFVHVHEWENVSRGIPKRVTVIYQAERAVRPANKNAPSTLLFWCRRDWTPEADLVYVECPVGKTAPVWIVDEEQSYEHGDGFCHFVWVRNWPNPDKQSCDGLPDYHALYDNLTKLDVVSSVTTRGAALNLDPTLKLRMDPEIVNRYGVKKGSDNALVVGKDGDAEYMELGGTSIQIGNELLDRREAHALRVAQCVSPDPNTIAAAGTSSVALKLVYRPMLSRASVMRDYYGQGLVRLLEQMVESARRHTSETATEVDPETGEELEISYGLDLPQRVVTEDVLDDEGNPTGEQVIQFVERSPGEGGQLSLVWGDPFPATPAERQQNVTTLQLAAGGKPLLSHETAVRLAAKEFGVDEDEEWARIQEQEKQAREREAGMFLGTGGQVQSVDELPDGAEPLPETSTEQTGTETEGVALDETGATETVAGKSIEVTSAQVLNGAQIAQAVAIVKSVTAGEIPRDAGLGNLRILFNLTTEQAHELMGSAGLSQAAQQEVAPAPPAQQPEQPPPAEPPVV